MERQLKERLIGAAVLIAIAVVLVPEMFTGPKTRAPVADPTVTRNGVAEAATDQLKTWRVNLQDTPVASVSSSVASSEASVTVEPPAAAPREEAMPTSAVEPRVTAASSTASSSAMSKASSSASSSAAAMAPRTATVASNASSSANSSVSNSAVAAPHVAEPIGKWQVQIGSFAAEAKAKQLAVQLKSQGQSATVSSVQSGGKTLFRVRVAAGTSRDAAQAALKKLSATYPGASLVAPGK